MFKTNDRPVLVDCVVDPDDMVFPMVKAGGSNDEVILNEDDLKNI
jgi:thiamine pyrophosphate-dependent acetolactate synthase large subunit-like protein